MKRLTVIAILLCLLLSGSITAQTINIIHVDANAVPGGIGTLEQPYRTITQAVNAAKANSNTTIDIGTGVYRESVLVNKSGLTLRGGDNTTISAGERLTGWAYDAGLWRAVWPYRFGAGANIWPGEVTISAIALRREAVYVGGVRYRPRLSRAELAPGDFYIDESNGLIWLYTHNAVDPNALEVETAARDYALLVQGVDGFTLDNVTVRYGASALAQGCVTVRDSNNVRLGGVDVQRCSYAGLQIDRVTGLDIFNVIASDNGARGIGMHRILTARIDRVRMVGNGWRVALDTGSLMGWDGGNKWLRLHDALVTDLHIAGTRGVGLWLDYDNHNVTVDGFSVADSVLAGIFIEANCSPTIIFRNGVIFGTPAYGSDLDYFHAGLFITGTNGLRVENVTFSGNARYDILASNPVRSVLSWRPVAPSCTTTQRGMVFVGIDAQSVRFARDTTGYVSTIRYNTDEATMTSTASITATQTVTQTATVTATSTATTTSTATETGTIVPTVTASPTVEDSACVVVIDGVCYVVGEIQLIPASETP